MRITEPGPVCDELLLLGDRQVSSYLVKGEVYALIGGGTAWGVPRLEEQFDRFGVDRSRLRYVVVSHAHHDHCGAVPYLLRRYPGLQAVASAPCADLLVRERPVRVMRELNARTLERLGLPASREGVSLEFAPIPVPHRPADGEALDLGRGLTLSFYTTPGHSRCSTSVHASALAALFPGDSIPSPHPATGELTVTANHDYGDYLASLRKLERLDVSTVAYEHGGVLTGEAARGIVARGLEAARKQRDRLRKRFEELGDEERLVEELTAKFHALELFRLLPQENVRAIVARLVRSALAEGQD